MNIVLLTSSGNIVVRPDTTWEKDNEDVFLPEEVTEVTCSPVIFARICKPGRSIGRKFASRYLDSFNYGVLLYPENFITSEEGYACASCLDHTSFLPSPLLELGCLGEGKEGFALTQDDNEIFRVPGCLAEKLEDAISVVSSRVYLRTGDFVAIELAERMPLLKKEEGSRTRVQGCFDGKTLVDFNIIMG